MATAEANIKRYPIPIPQNRNPLTSVMPAVYLYHFLRSLLSYLFPSKLTSWLSNRQQQGGIITSEETASMESKDAEGTHKQQLLRVFNTFDKNGDGMISSDEMKRSLSLLGIHMNDEEIAQAIQNVDANGDGFVDFEEFKDLYESMKSKTEDVEDEPEEEEEAMKEAFNVFDENGDGVISVEELQAVFASLGLREGRAVSACQSMISNVDTDGDGMVNYAEFKRMMRGGAGFATDVST